MARRLIVEIIGDSASLERALGTSAAAASGFAARMSTLGDRLSSIGRTMTTHLTLPIVAAGAVSTKFATDFQSSMELVHTQAGLSQQAVDSMSKSLIDMARSVGTGPETLSQGLFHL